METKVSVIVPVYKVERYLDRCVQSIFNQTYKNLEIILVDDGSPDNCPKMCDAYKKADGRVTVIHKENGGLSDARNAGMDIATGDYVLFVDSDDWIEHDTIETLQSIAEKEKVDFVHFCAVWDGRNGVPDGTPCTYERSRDLISGYYDRERIKKELYHRLLITHDLFLGPVLPAWSALYRRDFLDSNGIRFDKPIRYSEDSLFSSRVVMAADSFIAIETCFYHYCFNLGSISFGKHKDWWEVAKLRSVYFEKYFASCDEYDFSVQLKRMAVFNVLDGLSEWSRCETDSQKIEEIKMVLYDDFTKEAMKNIGVCKVPFRKRIVLYLIKFKLVKIYFWIFNKK